MYRECAIKCTQHIDKIIYGQKCACARPQATTIADYVNIFNNDTFTIGHNSKQMQTYVKVMNNYVSERP